MLKKLFIVSLYYTMSVKAEMCPSFLGQCLAHSSCSVYNCRMNGCPRSVGCVTMGTYMLTLQ